MRRLGVLALLVPFLGAPAAQAAPPPEVLAWTTSAGAWVSVDGAAGHLVVPGARDVAVSPDGTRLATIRVVDIGGGRGRPRLFVSGIDGSGALNVTPGDDGTHSRASAPAFSPDGSRIAYAWFADDYSVPSQVRIIPSEGGPLEAASVTTGGEPSWSPDGAYLAEAGGTLRLTTLDGRQYAGGYGDIGHIVKSPAWSPDGRRVLLGDDHYTAGGSTDLASHVFGSGANAVVAVGASSPAWTRDGSKLYDVAGGMLERRLADGTVDSTFTPVAGAGNPSSGGGPALPVVADGTAPGPVSGLTATYDYNGMQLTSTLPGDPDIAGVVVRYAKGAAAPATPTEGMTAGRAPGGDAFVPRLLADTLYSFSLFTIDWSGNVSTVPVSVSATTPHEIAVEMRVSSSNGTLAELPYGEAVTESARLIRSDTGAGLPNALVTLTGQVGTDPEKVLATARTDASGLVRFTRRPLRFVTYGLKYAGDGQLQPVSSYVQENVVQVALASVSPHIARVGSRAVYDFVMRPAAAGRHLVVRQLIGTTEVARRAFTLDRYGHARVLLDTSRHGNEVLETFLPQYDGMNPVRSRIGFGVA